MTTKGEVFVVQCMRLNGHENGHRETITHCQTTTKNDLSRIYQTKRVGVRRKTNSDFRAILTIPMMKKAMAMMTKIMMMVMSLKVPGKASGVGKFPETKSSCQAAFLMTHHHTLTWSTPACLTTSTQSTSLIQLKSINKQPRLPSKCNSSTQI